MHFLPEFWVTTASLILAPMESLGALGPQYCVPYLYTKLFFVVCFFGFFKNKTKLMHGHNLTLKGFKYTFLKICMSQVLFVVI